MTPEAKFKIGQVCLVGQANLDKVISKRYRPKYWVFDGNLMAAGWWYKFSYLGDCEEFHESDIRALTKKEMGL